MLLECQNCGAPLDARPNVRMVKCRYCGRTSTVQSMRTIAQQAPQGWRPPPVWVPPQHFPAPSQPIRYQRGANPAVFIVLASVVLAGVGAFVAIGVGSGGHIVTQAARRAAAPLDKGQSWDGTSTLQCGINEKLVIENKTVTLADQTLINASMNCRLTIKNCTLTGAKIVEAATNSHVDVVGSSLTASETAIDGSMAVQVRIEKNSRVKAEETAVKLGQASKLYVDKSSVEARESAIYTGQASRVEVRSSSVTGSETSIEVGQVSTVVLRDAKISGKRKLGSSTSVEEH